MKHPPMTATEVRLRGLLREQDKRIADAEAEANNAMAQSLENEKTITTLQLQVQRLERLIEQLKEDD